MIRVTDLNREQLIELKQAILTGTEGCDNTVSYSDLANADNLVNDNEVYAMYSSVCFVSEDFSSGNM